MIRIEEAEGWILVGHRDHAHLAGALAAHWGNEEFAPPEPRADVLTAVVRHDDAWAARDAQPFLTREMRPGAFSRELVGRYSAFEEIDLADYLAVRGRASDVVASANPYAAALISMHTVNLLTERSDPEALTPDQRELIRTFVAAEERKQAELLGPIAADAFGLQRGFEFLQACDSLSLAICVRYDRPIMLRHAQPRRDGTLAMLECTPLGGDTYRVAPYPFDADTLEFTVPCRRVAGRAFTAEVEFRRAFAEAPVVPFGIVIRR